jgi:hypothetical protein
VSENRHKEVQMPGEKKMPADSGRGGAENVGGNASGTGGSGWPLPVPEDRMPPLGTGGDGTSESRKRRGG